MANLKITTKATEALRAVADEAARKIASRTRAGLPTEALKADLATFTLKLLDAQEPLRIPVDETLREVNGTAHSFTVTSYDEILYVTGRAEDRLSSRGVSRSAMTGCEVRFRPAGPSASSYKGRPISTAIRLRRVVDGWRLVGVERTIVYPKQAEVLEITLSEAARDSIMRWAFDGMKEPKNGQA